MSGNKAGRAPVIFVAGVVLFGSLATAGLGKARSGGCPPFRPSEPESPSEQTGEALEEKVLAVRDRATESRPVVVEFDQEPSLWIPTPTNPMGQPTPVMEETSFFNVQVDSKKDRVSLNVRLIWDSPHQVDDLDLILYNADGKEVDRSDGPTGQPESLELISFGVNRCEGFSIEVRGYRSRPLPAKLEVWLASG